MPKKSSPELAIGNMKDINIAIYLRDLETRVSTLENNNKKMLKLLVTLKKMLNVIAKGKVKK
jgi:hypothetical protein